MDPFSALLVMFASWVARALLRVRRPTPSGRGKRFLPRRATSRRFSMVSYRDGVGSDVRTIRPSGVRGQSLAIESRFQRTIVTPMKFCSSEPHCRWFRRVQSPARRHFRQRSRHTITGGLTRSTARPRMEASRVPNAVPWASASSKRLAESGGADRDTNTSGDYQTPTRFEIPSESGSTF
jgi:hypothetical protein